MTVFDEAAPPNQSTTAPSGRGPGPPQLPVGVAQGHHSSQWAWPRATTAPSVRVQPGVAQLVK
ncbi:hypothetical protein EYF80_045891 [Liparis tanakae]|uniref:Uncharacterized protein n=1 Tax=Liparis tanakae TaxID=230148 RepID=A0A4Z2FRY8_9TELE|nr:hypothetical protein EYF80_045891 [Liparis tanakae]